MDAAAAPPAAIERPSVIRLSPLTRRIVALNLAALTVLVAGFLQIDPHRAGYAARLEALALSQVGLLADLAAHGADLRARELPGGSRVSLTNMSEGKSVGGIEAAVIERSRETGRPFALRDAAGAIAAASPVPGASERVVVLWAKAPQSWPVGGQIARLLVMAALVALVLGIGLAAGISAPLRRLTRAAEAGGAAEPGAPPERIDLPDLGDRSDEIGRLSAALRGMVDALYERIDANDRFAADVTHEIKNPLASLTSAVASLRRGVRPDQQTQLLDIAAHDLQRLDRLVSDISAISRLDAELVRGTEATFDLTEMVSQLAAHVGEGARRKGIELEIDMPEQAVEVRGLESRLAQVLVNLMSNAVSFCSPGDSIRVWLRRRDARVILVVEDTGPGLPDGAEERIFERFYSERPDGDFGNNSGLGLAICKQIVEAHGGVIWAENVTGPEGGEAVHGARFIVGLAI